MALPSMPARLKIGDDLNLFILEDGIKIMHESNWKEIIKPFIYTFLEV